ncbi:MAG: glycosyltransferase family 39 protein [Candidatus Micrarchaeota archaeon]|nr:glycosyltransferase family 39 protein [Candidatus Micrarchaeota archaeon]
MIALLGILSSAFLPFYNNFGTIYFVYYIDVLALLAAALVIARKEIASQFAGIGRRGWYPIMAVIAAFLLVELLLVQPYHLVYNDEYIYMSIAKSMITDHVFGICSFSTATHCVPGTTGFFHQPGGWPLLLAAAFSIFGIGIGTAYYLTLLMSAISVLLVFLISYMLFSDARQALMSSVALASIPLFLSYSRTSLADPSALAFLLLSILLFMVYLRQKSLRTGFAAVMAFAFLTCIKTEMVIAVPILAGFLLLSSGWFRGRDARARIWKAVALAAFAAVLLIPQMAFFYYSAQDSFGAAIYMDQSKLSLQNLGKNMQDNLLFWTGAFSTMRTSGGGVFSFVYHVEFPLTLTAFAVIGAAAMVALKKFRELAMLLVWFLAIFLFYTSYYAGSALYGLGVDARYFLGSFAALSVFAGYGFVQAYEFIRGMGKGRSRKRWGTPLLTMLFLLFISMPLYQFVTITMLPASTIAPYAGQRAGEAYLLSNLDKIPQNCTVITFKPPFWYVMNRSNIYATWATSQSKRATLMNMSHGCLYFDYDLNCYEGNRPGTGYGNTENECRAVLSNYTYETVSTGNYTGYSWDVVWHIYRITGLSGTNSSG